MATGDDLADPVFGAAEARLAEPGYDASGSGETGCSQGAREALPQLKESRWPSSSGPGPRPIALRHSTGGLLAWPQ